MCPVNYNTGKLNLVSRYMRYVQEIFHAAFTIAICEESSKVSAVNGVAGLAGTWIFLTQL